MLQRDAIGGTGATAQTTAENPKRHTPRRRAGPRARTNNTRAGAHEQGPKQPATTRNTHRARGRVFFNKATHTAPNSPECNQIKDHETTHWHQGKKQQEHSAHSHNGEAGQTPGARNGTWPPAATANPGVTPRILQNQRYITHPTVEHCAAEPCTALQLPGHPKSYGIIFGDTCFCHIYWSGRTRMKTRQPFEPGGTRTQPRGISTSKTFSRTAPQVKDP